MKRLPSTFSAENFEFVWRQSRDSKASRYGGAGVDGTTAPAFKARLDENIFRIRAEIRAGIFRFAKLRLAPVLKPSGDFRIIAIPTVRDRLVQRVILNHLEADAKFDAGSPISYGFLKDRTLPDAQRQAIALRNEYPWVLQADIVKFFDNIEREIVRKLVRKHVKRKVVSELIQSAINCELDEGGKQGARIARENGIRKGRGLRQGMPLSPVLSNLLLKEFDQKLDQHGIKAIRYADDIAVFSSSKNGCKDALTVIQNELSKIGLEIPSLENNGKTILTPPSETIEFLGIDIRRSGIKYRPYAPTKKIEKIRRIMIEISTLENCAAEKFNIGQLSKHLDRFIIGHSASMALIDDRQSFVERIEAAKKEALRNLIVEIFGSKAISHLDDRKMAIIGIKDFP